MNENKTVKTIKTPKEKTSFIGKIKRFWKSSIKNMSSIRQILLWYLIISITGALLLWAPISHSNDLEGGVSFIDALFTSSSAFSDTGLSTVGIEETFNWFGQLVTLILLNIGGVGWFTIKIFLLSYILRKTTRYNDIHDGSSELGTKTKNQTMGLVVTAIIISVFSTFFFGIIFGIIFATVMPDSGFNASLTSDVMSWGQAMWTGIYHASASVNNSGLDIFVGDNSMESYAGNIGIQLITIFLFILGGIGFGVFYDLYLWLNSKKTGRKFSFSLITKLSVSIYFIVAFVGLVLAYTVEGLAVINDPDAFLSQDSDLGLRIWAITFNTFSTRNAGFSTMDISKLQDLTLIIQSLMMFIGSGPGSTAGGLRTTTFGVIIISFWSNVRNKKAPTVFGKTISIEITKDAMKIFFASVIIIIVGIFLLSLSESLNSDIKLSDKESINYMYLVFSAFGTTGLSPEKNMGDYNTFSKFILILIMFIGQMGISTTVSQAKTKQIRFQKQYIEEYINLG